MDREDDNAGRSTAQLLRAIAEDSGTLVRKEIELARQEIDESLGKWLQAVAAIAVAAVLGTSTIVLLGFAAVAVLDDHIPDWAASLAVAAIAVALSLVAVSFARGRMRGVPVVPPETVRTLKEDVEWAKAQLKR